MSDMGESSIGCGGAAKLRAVADMFTELGRELRSSDGKSPFEAVVSVAARRVPGAGASTMTIVRDSGFQTVAATEERALRADLMQYEMRSGPCVDAIVEEALFHPDDLRHDMRWPEYCARVSGELGWRSMLSYRLSSELTGDAVAGLNLYADRAHAFDDEAAEIGLLLATHGAAVVAAHLNERRAANLENALRTSREIGTAVGVLMSAHKLTRDQAFDLLRIASQRSNRKIREIAVEVADTGTLAPLSPSR